MATPRAVPPGRIGALPLHVEVIGATSAGKSTLTRALEEACRRRGIDATNSDDLALAPLGLERVAGEFLRRRLVDAPALLACLGSWRRHRELCSLALAASRRAPGGWTRRLNLARNALRKIGLHEIVRRRGGNRLVLVDNEGVLQAAHNLFVHVAAESSDADLTAFMRLAPLPDAVVYVEEVEEVLVARTLARGHRRVPAGSAEGAARFVSRAVRVFETITTAPAVRARLVVVGPDRSVRLAPEAKGDPRLLTLTGLVREAVALARAAFPGEHLPTTPAGDDSRDHP